MTAAEQETGRSGRGRAHRAPALLRRAALLRAAIEIIGEHGVGAVTHRAVAARAGVPVANTTYFFSSIDELVEEAFRAWVRQRSAEMDAVAQRTFAAHASPAEIVDAFVDLLFGDIDTAAEQAQYEAYLHAARSPALRDAAATAQAAFERAAAAALRAAGVPNPAEGARALVALTDGFLIQHLAVPRPDAASAFHDAVRALFIAYAMTDEERAAGYARFQRPRHPASPV